MCRFTLYLGPPVRLATLLTEPAHSLIHQSYQSEERAEPLNGDGFGVGWYAPGISEEPGLFRSVSPAWNNRNLERLADVVTSPCILAHVRAATKGMEVNESNCHPFPYRRFLFMHNGHVGGFDRIRRQLLAGLTEEAFDLVRGSTDTEHLFAVFVDEMVRAGDDDPGARLGEYLNRAVWRVLALTAELVPGATSNINVAVADGERAAACRFTDAATHPPESLYYIARQLYEPVQGEGPARRLHEGSRSMLVSSERLTDDEGWVEVPPNHLLTLDRESGFVLRRMTPDGLVNPLRP